MGGLLDKPKVVTPPPVPVTPPVPVVDDEVGDQARRSRPRGREETFLTGELTPSEEFLRGKKRRLA